MVKKNKNYNPIVSDFLAHLTSLYGYAPRAYLSTPQLSFIAPRNLKEVSRASKLSWSKVGMDMSQAIKRYERH